MMQIDLQCSFLVGSAMAVIGREQLRSGRPEALTRGYMLALAFGAIVFTPLWIYISLRWTAWESMYVWDLRTLPSGLMALFPPALSVAALAGFRATAALLSAGRAAFAAAVNLAVIGSCIVVVLLGWDRFTFVGTQAEFASGKRGNLLESDLLVFIVRASIFLFAPAMFFLIRELRRA